MSNEGPVLIPIFGDQLTRDLASLRGQTKEGSIVLMMEVLEEATYLRHHKQKLVLTFSAMRHFAAELRDAGWPVDYVCLEDADNSGSFTGELSRAIDRYDPVKIRVVEASEWRVQDNLELWPDKFACEVEILPDDRFIVSKQEFREWAQTRDHLTMEHFYRRIRRKTGLLMEGDKPAGGSWNYDKHNRESPDEDLCPPDHVQFKPDNITLEVIDLVEKRFGDHFGSLDSFFWPVTRQQAEQAADAFFENRLEQFGPYQDAMLHGQDYLFHSMLSTSINIGLLDPLELCQRAERYYCDGKAPLNSVEGFIRQLIGWREYVRGFYWYCMPGLAQANYLDADRDLPDFYWTGETDMRCMADCIRSTQENAHAHHIQRLMVLGNFALLAGINPQQVQDWFLIVYADAFEWVELPNVAAMALYADGGKLATKPYAASGNYINKMSDYCSQCAYSPAKKTGAGACPFNPLYWHFMDRHREQLKDNHRIGRIFATWDRMGPERQRQYLDSAEAILAELKPADPGWAREV